MKKLLDAQEGNESGGRAVRSGQKSSEERLAEQFEELYSQLLEND